MAKKTIKSYDEFMKIAVEAAFGEKAEQSRKMWEESLEQRYKSEEPSFRMGDVGNGDIIHDKEISELFSNLDRLELYIKNETDVVNKTAAIATRHVVSAGLDDLLKQYTFSEIDKIYDVIAGVYDISEEAVNEYRNNHEQYIRAGENRDENTPLSEVSLGQLNAKEKTDVYNSVVSSFFDREVWKDKDGNVIQPGKAANEVLDEITEYARQMDMDARFANNPEYEANSYDDEFEKAYVEELTQEFAAEEIIKLNEYEQRLANFKNNVTTFSSTVVSQDLDEVHLELDQSPFVDFTIDEFVQNQKKGNLSNIELAWAESNLNSMVSSLYTKDELRAFKQAGIDPAMGILIDGKPVDWHHRMNSFDSFYRATKPIDDAKNKSEIVSKALQGARIDVCKLNLNDKGGVDVDKIVPVKTDTTLKPRKWSFIRWLKEFLGIVPKIMDKIMAANKSERNYTQEEVAAAKRNAVKLKARAESALQLERRDQYSKDFFGEVFFDGKVFNETNLGGAFQYTNAKGDNNSAIKTIGRKGTDVNMALLFGMSKGHSLNELLAPENTELRKNVGQQFVEELGVITYGRLLEKTDAGLYNQYLELREIWNAEKAEAAEAARKAKEAEKARKAGQTEKVEEVEETEEAKRLKEDEKLRRDRRKAEINENLKASQKLYGQYLIERRENIERFCLESSEAFRKQPLTVTSPFDTDAFIENYQMISLVGSMAKDWSQSLVTIEKNWFESSENPNIDFGFDNTDKEYIKQADERAETVYNYCSDLNDLTALPTLADDYFCFLMHNSYSTNSFNIDDRPNLIKAARGKAAVQYASERINEGSTIGDIIDNTELCSKIGGVFFSCYFMRPDDVDIAEAHLEHHLYNDNPETSNLRLIETDKGNMENADGGNGVYVGLSLVEQYTVDGEEKEATMELICDPLERIKIETNEKMEELLAPFKADEDTSVLDAYNRLMDHINGAENDIENNVEIAEIGEDYEIKDDEKAAPDKQLMTFAEITQTEKPKQTTKQTTSQKQTPEKTSEIKR